MSDDFDEYIVKFRYMSEYKNVYIKRADLDVDTLINLAFDAFEIQVYGSVVVKLQDNMDIHIPRDKVLQHIKAFWRNDTFYFDMTYTGDLNSNAVGVITPRMVEDYMKHINERQLLTDCKAKQEINVPTRQRLVQIAVDFLVVNYGIGANTFHRHSLAKALVKLFPSLGIQNGNDFGTRLLINGANGGWLNTRLYYVRVTKRKQVQAEAVSAARDVDSPPSEADGIYDPKNDIDLLKSLIVGDENLEVFRQKLNATREYRAQMMTKKETEIKEHFPYFFTHPMKLIPLEFDEKYKNSEVDSNGLFDSWASYRPQLEQVLTSHKKNAFETDWDPSVHELLLLLQLFPSTQKGRNATASSSTFEASIAKLIQFELTYTPPNELAPRSRSYPIIVAVGDSEREIAYFCLKLEGKTIPLPENVDFLHVFDLFFKVHKIFDLNYEPALRNMMIFVENFIYNLKGEHEVTNRMLDIARHLKLDD